MSKQAIKPSRGKSQQPLRGFVVLALGLLSAGVAMAEPVPASATRDAIFIRPAIPLPPFPVPVINVQPAPVQVVVNEAPIQTIDIAGWLGYHAGDQIRIAIQHVIYVRPHSATTGTETLQGSAVAVWPEGIFYTRELPASLTARLAALGWGQGSSTLTAAAPAAEQGEPLRGEPVEPRSREATKSNR